MLRTHHVLTAALLSIAVLFGGCAARSQVIAAAPQPVMVAAPPALLATEVSPQLVSDPVSDLIALSNNHFEAGQSELQLGHLDSARSEFNKALDILLESPYGARSEPRIREHFDRLEELSRRAPAHPPPER